MSDELAMEAARTYSLRGPPEMSKPLAQIHLERRAFLAGAAWQAEQDRKFVTTTIRGTDEERRKGGRSIKEES